MERYQGGIKAMTYLNNTLRIMIDPGYGCDDDRMPNTCPGDENINLSIAFYLRYELEKEGMQHIELTRYSNIYVPLARRIELAELYNADMFISIHCDNFYREKENGYTIWIGTAATGNTFLLADRTNRNFTRDFPNHKRFGIKHGKHQVVNQPRTSILVECKAIRKPENQVKFAQSIKDAVIWCAKR